MHECSRRLRPERVGTATTEGNFKLQDRSRESGLGDHLKKPGFYLPTRIEENQENLVFSHGSAFKSLMHRTRIESSIGTKNLKGVKGILASARQSRVTITSHIIVQHRHLGRPSSVALLTTTATTKSPNMQSESTFRKFGRRFFPASSTSVNQVIRQ